MEPKHICKSDQKLYVFTETLDNRRFHDACIQYAPHLFLQCARTEALCTAVCNYCAQAFTDTDTNYKFFTISDLVPGNNGSQHYACKYCRIRALGPKCYIEKTESVRATLFIHKKLCLQIININKKTTRCCYKEASSLDSGENPLCRVHTEGKAVIKKIKERICRPRTKRYDLCKFEGGCPIHASFGVLSSPFVEVFCKIHKQPGMFNLRMKRTTLKSIDITEYFTSELNNKKMSGVAAYSVYKTAGDGNCFFNCVSKALFQTDSNWGPHFLREKMHLCAKKLNTLQLVSSYESEVYGANDLSILVQNRLSSLSKNKSYFDLTLVPAFCNIFMVNVLLVTESGNAPDVAPYQSFVVDVAWSCLILLYSSTERHVNILSEGTLDGEYNFIFDLSESNRLSIQLQLFFQITANTKIIDSGGIQIQSREQFFAALKLEYVAYGLVYKQQPIEAGPNRKRKNTTATDNNSEPQHKNNKKSTEVNPAVVNAELVKTFSKEEMAALRVTATQVLKGVYVALTKKASNSRTHTLDINQLASKIDKHVQAIKQVELLQNIINNIKYVEDVLGGRDRAVLFFNLYQEKTLKTDKILKDIGSSTFMGSQLVAEIVNDLSCDSAALAAEY